MLEQEGLNAWGVWDFSEWDLLAAHLRKGFEYAKQRCTAYPRYVVQRELIARRSSRCTCRWSSRSGSVIRWRSRRRRPPAGPRLRPGDPRHQGQRAGRSLRRGVCAARHPDLPGHASATGASSTGRTPPPTSRRVRARRRRPSWSLHHAEPFGPLDSIVVVDTESELLAAMNASNGSLVAQHRLRRRAGLRRAARRAAAGVQGRHQQAAQPGRPRRGLRRHGRVLEGRVRRRRPAGAGRHRGPTRTSGSTATSRPILPLPADVMASGRVDRLSASPGRLG